jgi:signal transduction histidine kinase
VELKYQGEEAELMADQDKISQVIINLLANALKYTPTHGFVELSIRADLQTVKINVKDSGLGIPPEDLPYIFERFYRADKSRNRQTGGAGIGLTIAKAIVEAHQGTIMVNSVLGKGTEFIVTLPKLH